MPAATKQNIGVYCNPEHKLWVEESGPSVEDVRSGQALKEGEVTIAIKSTGICGYVSSLMKKIQECSFQQQEPYDANNQHSAICFLLPVVSRY